MPTRHCRLPDVLPDGRNCGRVIVVATSVARRVDWRAEVVGVLPSERHRTGRRVTVDCRTDGRTYRRTDLRYTDRRCHVDYALRFSARRSTSFSGKNRQVTVTDCPADGSDQCRTDRRTELLFRGRGCNTEILPGQLARQNTSTFIIDLLGDFGQTVKCRTDKQTDFWCKFRSKIGQTAEVKK